MFGLSIDATIKAAGLLMFLIICVMYVWRIEEAMTAMNNDLKTKATQHGMRVYIDNLLS